MCNNNNNVYNSKCGFMESHALENNLEVAYKTGIYTCHLVRTHISPS